MDDLQVVNKIIGEILTGADVEFFSYSGIYSIVFNNTKYSNKDFVLEIASIVEILNKDGRNFLEPILGLKEIVGTTVVDAKINEEYDLELFLNSNFRCKVYSKITEYDPEGLFDLAWTIYEKGNTEGLSIWVSPQKEIFVRQ